MTHHQKRQGESPKAQLHWKFLCFYMILIAGLIIFSYFGGYRFLEPLGWHHYLEAYFPNMYAVWDGLEAEKAYSVSYGWIILLIFLQIPIYFYSYLVCRKKSNFAEFEAKSIYFQLYAIFLPLIVTYILVSTNYGGTRLDFIFQNSGFLILIILWGCLSGFIYIAFFYFCGLCVHFFKKYCKKHQK